MSCWDLLGPAGTCSRLVVAARATVEVMSTPRLTARVTDEARRGWDRATLRHGCTLTALIEALGLSLDERGWEVPEEVVLRAQAIDRERFSRR